MKLTYRDKVILGIVLAIAIFVAGYFALIKPKNQTIKNDSDRLDTLEETKKDYESKIKQIEPLKETINATVDETNKITDKFVDKDAVDNPVKLDKFMQKFATDNEIRITTLAVGDMAESTLGYYFIESMDIGSGLRSIADINGSYQADVDKMQAEATALKDREVPPVLVTQYGITAEGTKENLWKLMDAVEKYDDALLINSVSYELLDEEENASSSAPQGGEGEGKTPAANNNNDTEEHRAIEPDDMVTINMVISLYSVYDLQQVDVDAIK